MPQPTPGNLHVDHYLTDVQLVFTQEEKDFISGRVFPQVPVQKESDLFAIYDRGFFYRNEMKPRPLGGKPVEAGYEIGEGRYACEEYALEHLIDDRTRSNADEPLDPDLAAMRLLTTQALINRDVKWVEAYFKEGVWTLEYEGVESSPSGEEFLQFDQEGANPIPFMRKLVWKVKSRTGYKPNKLVLGVDAFEGAINNPAVLDRIKYTEFGSVDEVILARLFGVDEVLVPAGVQNSAKEGQENDIDFIVGTKDALLVYAAPAPTINAPSAGYTFAHVGLLPGATNAFGGVIERGRDDRAKSDWIHSRQSFDIALVAADLGVFLSEAVSE